MTSMKLMEMDSSVSISELLLKSENKNYSDIKVNPSVDELNFEGICVGLLRNLS